ncbi:MAG: nickel pincer cofactor biosynthesis protein LarC [Actinobacteria bacterium]|jgi:uncharacterized protein (TIGR00299 family) protein|nr:nickel pincer cofactor biosynthesis protein LarC [Actinomycetota bacterium]
MEKTILYIDPWSGISGDMLLAALLDAGRAEDHLDSRLRAAVVGLGVEGVTVDVLRDVEWGVDCTRLRVHEKGTAPLRHLVDMERIIGAASVSESVKAAAIEAVRRLAVVEAQVHGCAVEDIHFHEVGAMDTLVDVVGAFTLIEALHVDEVVVGTIPVGGGMVEIAHGRMGVPAPATARLLQGYEITGGPEQRELTTPTGALLLSQLGARQGVLPRMRVEKIGYGAGSMKLEHGPNVLRVLIGTAGEPAGEGLAADEVVELQTNLDDVSPEIVGHAVRLLRGAGALDVWTIPASMKKDRPAVVLHALVRPGEEAAAATILFAETGTLGIRSRPVHRDVAERGTITVKVEDAEIRVKCGRWQGRLVSVAPEYEDAAAASTSTGRPLKDVMFLAAEAARRLQGEPDEAEKV